MTDFFWFSDARWSRIAPLLPTKLPVANAVLYEQPQILNNRLYQQYSRVFAAAQPFPNNFTSAGKRR